MAHFQFQLHDVKDERPFETGGLDDEKPSKAVLFCKPGIMDIPSGSHNLSVKVVDSLRHGGISLIFESIVSYLDLHRIGDIAGAGGEHPPVEEMAS